MLEKAAVLKETNFYGLLVKMKKIKNKFLKLEVFSKNGEIKQLSSPARSRSPLKCFTFLSGSASVH
jgi:hypothetical protein